MPDTFQQVINEYMNICKCSAKDLAIHSGISQSSISRYRKGERTPNENSDALSAIAGAFVELSSELQPLLRYEEVYKHLCQAAEVSEIDTKKLVNNLNTLISLFDINATQMAKEINYDPSHLSRIRSFQRAVTNPYEFASQIASYVIHKYKSKEEQTLLRKIVNSEQNDLRTALIQWLCNGKAYSEESVSNFLKTLESFNLDEYIQSIHFNDIKVLTLPFSFPTRKQYFGINRMRQGELDFFKATILSRSNDSVFMCSDMPMTEMAKDLDFDKKWMISIAVMLKKGLKINVIHNLERPWNEMMLGLEAWIPIYMTGQVQPFYFKKAKNNIYHHIQYVSGTAALTGECVDGYMSSGKYYLTNNKDEVMYYRQKAEHLLKKASPLMEIYTEEREKEFLKFLENEKDEEFYLQPQALKAFKNIEVIVCHNKLAIVSKKMHPKIHYVIHHPRLVESIENFSAAIDEN